MNYVATQQPYLIPYVCSEKRTSKLLLLQFGTSCEPDVQADNFIISCNDIQYILDGGAFLQHIPWSCGSTCQDILNRYTEYAARKYGNAIVVFDG